MPVRPMTDEEIEYAEKFRTRGRVHGEYSQLLSTLEKDGKATIELPVGANVASKRSCVYNLFNRQGLTGQYSILVKDGNLLVVKKSQADKK